MQCKGKTSQGRQCERVATIGNYCHLHHPDRSPNSQKANLKTEIAKSLTDKIMPLSEGKDKEAALGYTVGDLLDPNKHSSFLAEVALKVISGEIAPYAAQSLNALSRAIRSSEEWREQTEQEQRLALDRMSPMQFAQVAADEVFEMSGGKIRLEIITDDSASPTDEVSDA